MEINILDELNAFNDLTLVSNVSVLEIEKPYKVIRVKYITQFKKQLVAVEIEDEEHKIVHLPDRWIRFFTQEKINETNMKENLFLIYLGKKKNGKFEHHYIEWKVIEEKEEKDMEQKSKTKSIKKKSN